MLQKVPKRRRLKIFLMRRSLRGKKFTPRIPREELLRKTSEALKAYGADHHSQAKLMTGIAAEVIDSENPIFTSIHPHPKLRQEKAWKRAYTIVAAYLSALGMEMTIDTMNLEAGNAEFPVDSSCLNGTNPVKYMNSLLTISRHLGDIDFGQKVDVFAGIRKRFTPREVPQKRPQQSSVQSKPAPKQTQKAVEVEKPKPTLKPVQEKPKPKPVVKEAPKPAPKPAVKEVRKPVEEKPKPVVKEEPVTFKRPTIRDLANADIPSMNFDVDDDDFIEDSESSHLKSKESSIANDFNSEPFESENVSSPAKSEAQSNMSQRSFGNDFDDEAEEASVEAEDAVEDIADDFDDEGTSANVEADIDNDFVDEGTSVTEASTRVEAEEFDDDDFDDVSESASNVVDVVADDVIVDDPTSESSRMVIQMPESSTIEQISSFTIKEDVIDDDSDDFDVEVIDSD